MILGLGPATHLHAALSAAPELLSRLEAVYLSAGNLADYPTAPPPPPDPGLENLDIGLPAAPGSRVRRGVARRWWLILPLAAAFTAAGVWSVDRWYRPGFTAETTLRFADPAAARRLPTDPAVLSAATRTAGTDRPAEALRAGLRADAGPDGVAALSLSGSDPAEVERTLSAIAAAAVRAAEAAPAALDRRIEQLGRARDEAAEALRRAEAEAAAFADRTGADDAARRAASPSTAADEVAAELTKVEIALTGARARAAALRRMTEAEIVRPDPAEVKAAVDADPLLLQWEVTLGDLRTQSWVKTNQVYTQTSREVRTAAGAARRRDPRGPGVGGAGAGNLQPQALRDRRGAGAQRRGRPQPGRAAGRDLHDLPQRAQRGKPLAVAADGHRDLEPAAAVLPRRHAALHAAEQGDR